MRVYIDALEAGAIQARECIGVAEIGIGRLEESLREALQGASAGQEERRPLFQSDLQELREALQGYGLLCRQLRYALSCYGRAGGEIGRILKK